MALRMNTTFLKVLKEVLLGLPITEPNMKRGNRGLEEEDLEPKGFRAGVDLCLGAMRSLFKGERERENTSQPKKEK